MFEWSKQDNLYWVCYYLSVGSQTYGAVYKDFPSDLKGSELRAVTYGQNSKPGLTANFATLEEAKEWLEFEVTKLLVLKLL